MKETDRLFKDYVSWYPYNKDNSLKSLHMMNDRNGRIYLYEGFFLWFSEYYPLYSNTINVLMSNNNHFRIDWKYYLAIMAVSTIKCEYLLRILELDFLEYGGKEVWLIEGISVVPEKIRKLCKINNILAHQPWMINIQDINVYNSNLGNIQQK